MTTWLSGIPTHFARGPAAPDWGKVIDSKTIGDEDSPVLAEAQILMLPGAGHGIVNDPSGRTRDPRGELHKPAYQALFMAEIVEALTDIPYNGWVAKRKMGSQGGGQIAVVHPALEDIRLRGAHVTDEP